ncbi:hypothetical protein ISCGN_028815 [Ixodes scapularis]
MNTTCADLYHSFADVVECRRHQNMLKSAVQTTLASGTRTPRSRPSLRRKSRDIVYNATFYLLGGSDSTRLVGTMSGDGYVVRRGASNPPLTYRLFDNAAHGLEPEFRLLDLADMKG